MIKTRHFIALFMLVFYSGTVFSQLNYTVNREKKIYIGFSGGMNFSGVKVNDKYRLLETTPQSSGIDTEKDYDKLFKNPGSQYGLYFSYTFKHKLSLIFQPAFQQTSFNYRTAYSWSDTVNNASYNIEMKHQQKINAVILPLGVRYDLSVKQIEPFIQAGIFASFRTHASKTIYYDYLIDEKVDKKTADQTGKTDLSQHLNKFNFGIYGGAGLTFFANYFAISLESNFQFGLLNVVNDQNRFADYTGLSTQYLDVLDQLHLYNLNFQLSVMFPIDNSISLGILRKRRH